MATIAVATEALDAGLDTMPATGIPAAASRRELAWASALYFALTFVLAWPLSAHPASSVLWMGADTPLFAWTLAWDVHALAHNPLSIFDANIFHPNRLTLAYSENLIGSAIFAAPAIWLADNLVLAVNLVGLSSCVLCGLGTFVLARRLGIGRAGALLAGTVFAFSPPRFGRMGQLHLTAVQWIPFALAALHRYLDERRPRDLWIFAALFTVQALASGHGAVFLILAAGMLVTWRLVFGEPAAPIGRLRDLGIPGLVLLLPSALILLPYRAVQQEVGLKRPLDATWWTDWWPSAIAFLASPSHVDRWLASRFLGPDIFDRVTAFLFPGIVPLVLAGVLLATKPGLPASGGARASRRLLHAARRVGVSLLALGGTTGLGLAVYVASVRRITLAVDSVPVLRIHEPWRPGLVGLLLLAVAGRALLLRVRQAGGRAALWRRLGEWRERSRRNGAMFYALLAAVGTWFSMGAPLGPWPWLYALPGFNFMRVPSRFSILALLGLAVLAGFGFDRVAKGLSPGRRRVLALALGAAMVAEFSMAPLATTAYQAEIPAVDRWLDSRPKPFVVAEVPFPEERDQAAYMVHSTAHWQKTIVGYSGIRPKRHEEANAVIREFPSERSLAMLASLGVNYVVVHGGNYRPGQWPAVEARLRDTKGCLTLVRADGADRVYQLGRP